jgi:hypothetical protein
MNDTNAKILARNRVNGQVNELAPVILEAIKPFVGTKITLQTGGFAAKIKSVLDSYLGCNKIYPKLQIYNHNSNYSLIFVFKTSEQAGEYSCVYQEEYVYFGVLDGHNLKELCSFTPRRTDYNIEEINGWRTKYHQAEAIKSEINSNLCHFGVY